MKDLNQQNARIFRIVHKDNIGSILENGCHCRSATAGRKYVEIGNPELMVQRLATSVFGQTERPDSR